MHYHSAHRHLGEEPSKYLAGIIGKEDTLAELGCGNGFYCQYLKDLASKVYCVEIEKEAIEEAKESIKADNVVFLNENAASTSIPSKSVNTVLLANSFHDMDKQAVHNEIMRILKPKGKVIVIDWEKTETTFGPPMWIRMAKEDYLSIFKEFRLVGEFKPSPHHYGLVLELVS